MNAVTTAIFLFLVASVVINLFQHYTISTYIKDVKEWRDEYITVRAKLDHLCIKIARTRDLVKSLNIPGEM